MWRARLSITWPQVNFPEIDLRQRLTVSRGYGVTEIHIPEGSDYVGKTISSSGLRDNDINVLTLYRGAKVIPNPRSERELEAGDRLLAFGKLESMKGLVPAKTRRKRQQGIQDLPELPVAEEALIEEAMVEEQLVAPESTAPVAQVSSEEE